MFDFRRIGTSSFGKKKPASCMNQFASKNKFFYFVYINIERDYMELVHFYSNF